LLITAGGLLSVVFGAGLAFLVELKRNMLLGEWELPSDLLILGRIPKVRMTELEPARR
jgi:hypothetical protein